MISVCCYEVAVLYHSWVIGEGIGDVFSDKQWVSSNWIRQSLLWWKYFLSFLSLFLPQPVFLQKVHVYFLWQLWASVWLFCKSCNWGMGMCLILFLKRPCDFGGHSLISHFKCSKVNREDNIKDWVQCCRKEEWCVTIIRATKQTCCWILWVGI